MPIGGHFENILEPISEQEHLNYQRCTRIGCQVHSMQEICVFVMCIRDTDFEKRGVNVIHSIINWFQ